MEHHSTTSRAEAERLLGIAEKLLGNKDLSGSKEFAILAKETEPLLEGADQILTVSEVLLAAEKRVNNNPQVKDWYAILQFPSRADDAEVIKKQYRRLALLLHPDKNHAPFADSAFRLVSEAWAVLSDPIKKTSYDNSHFPLLARVDLTMNQAQAQAQAQPKKDQKLPVRRSAKKSVKKVPAGTAPANNSSGSANVAKSLTYWTACPYCYNLYEYLRTYEGCCLRCDSCKRAFTGTEILSMPPVAPGKEAYYCVWGFFPLGFAEGRPKGKPIGVAEKYPERMPPGFGANGVQEDHVGAAQGDGSAGAGAQDGGVAAPGNVNVGAQSTPGNSNVAAQASATSVSAASSGAKKKRGRPRKNVEATA